MKPDLPYFCTAAVLQGTVGHYQIIKYWSNSDLCMTNQISRFDMDVSKSLSSIVKRAYKHEHSHTFTNAYGVKQQTL